MHQNKRYSLYFLFTSSLFFTLCKLSHTVELTSRCSHSLVWSSHSTCLPSPFTAPAAAVHWQPGARQSVIWSCEATPWTHGLLLVVICTFLKRCCLLWGLCWWRNSRQRLSWKWKDQLVRSLQLNAGWNSFVAHVIICLCLSLVIIWLSISMINYNVN